MAIKVPIRTVFDASDNAIGLSEFQSGDAVGTAHGGTGLTSLGSAGQVLQINSGGNGFEFGSKTSVNLDPYLQVANANINFVTKAVALSSNTGLINLINDRMQVANVNTLVTTQVNNLVASAPGALDTLNELAAAIGDDANFSTTITTSLATKAANSYVNNTFETKAVALASNNSLINLINDRLQVANAAAIYQTIAVERAAIANTNTRINVLEAGGALASNTYISANFLKKTDQDGQSTAGKLQVDSTSATTGVHIEDGIINIYANNGTPAYVDFYCEVNNAHRIRLQSAAHSAYSGNPVVTLPTTTGTLATQEYAASNTYVNTTFETKAVAKASNNSLLSLINDRIQVANVASSIRPSVFTVTSNTSIGATYHNDAVIVNSSDTVVLTITPSTNLTAGDTFKFYPIGSGDIRIDLDTDDQFLGTTLSSTSISAYSDSQISVFQNTAIQGQSFRDFVTTGLYTKVELLYAGSGNFVLTK